MGVDFYSCAVCDETFPDCGPHTSCAKCGGFIGPCCMDKMSKKYGYAEDDKALEYYGDNCIKECDNCTSQIVHDRDVMEWALNKLGVSFDDAKQTIEKERGIRI